jgi:hypothetical protein
MKRQIETYSDVAYRERERGPIFSVTKAIFTVLNGLMG